MDENQKESLREIVEAHGSEAVIQQLIDFAKERTQLDAENILLVLGITPSLTRRKRAVR